MTTFKKVLTVIAIVGIALVMNSVILNSWEKEEAIQECDNLEYMNPGSDYEVVHPSLFVYKAQLVNK